MITKVLIGVSLLALAALTAQAVEDGLGTNVARNIRVQTTGVIDLGGTAITNWSQVGSTAAVAVLQSATNVLNTRVNVDLAGATNLLYNATNVLNTRVNVDLAGATNALYKATNALNIRVNVDLADATNALNIRVNVDLVGATNVLNTAVTNLNARTNYWNNGVIIYQGTNTGLVAGNLYYLDGNTNWTSASASTNATAKGLIGLALGTTVANGLLLNGQYPTNTSFVSGAILYIDTNNCAITTNAPFQTNNVVRIVGYVINTSTIMFNPDRTYIEVLGQ